MQSAGAAFVVASLAVVACGGKGDKAKAQPDAGPAAAEAVPFISFEGCGGGVAVYWSAKTATYALTTVVDYGELRLGDQVGEAEYWDFTDGVARPIRPAEWDFFAMKLDGWYIVKRRVSTAEEIATARFDGLMKEMAKARADSKGKLGWSRKYTFDCLGHSLFAPWIRALSDILPNPKDNYREAEAYRDILFDPSRSALDRAGAAMGMVAFSILTVLDVVPGVGATDDVVVELRAGLKAIDDDLVRVKGQIGAFSTPDGVKTQASREFAGETAQKLESKANEVAAEIKPIVDEIDRRRTVIKQLMDEVGTIPPAGIERLKSGIVNLKDWRSVAKLDNIDDFLVATKDFSPERRGYAFEYWIQANKLIKTDATTGLLVYDVAAKKRRVILVPSVEEEIELVTRRPDIWKQESGRLWELKHYQPGTLVDEAQFRDYVKIVKAGVDEKGKPLRSVNYLFSTREAAETNFEQMRKWMGRDTLPPGKTVQILYIDPGSEQIKRIGRFPPL